MTETVLVGLIGLAGTVSAGLLGSLIPGKQKSTTERTQSVFDSYDELVTQLRGICKDQQEQIDKLVDELEKTRRLLIAATAKLEEAEREVLRWRYLYPDDDQGRYSRP